ncbi:MAG: efflux RND transporter permease subunit, partial [Lentisphaeraceae bacterium]|nr:efflux RND transporter permease subunit [Lentisphaeraceae bacterium]
MNTPSESGKYKGSIAWMAGNPIAANLLMLIIIGGGLWTAFHIQKEVFPDYDLDLVNVEVEYPGAAPSEVEQGIILPIEEAIQGIQGIKEFTSTSREGRGSLEIELVPGVDRMKIFNEIDQAISRIRTFPDDTEEPEVNLDSPQREVMQVVLYGDVDIWTLRKLGEELRDQMLSNEKITQVQFDDLPEYVTHVEIPRNILREYNLTLKDVSSIIEQSSKDIPAGTIETKTGEILLRLKEKKQWASELGKIKVIAAKNGSFIALEDIAEITDGFEEGGFHSQFNQKPSMELNIFRIGNQSPKEIADEVQKIMAEAELSLPQGVEWRIDGNAAKDYKDRLALLIENGLMALVIVLFILAIFLELRLAFWVMMGMTISFIGGMIFLPLIGVSINMISMFAFMVVLGIVVDDAIVVGENIYEHRLQGKSFMDAAIDGTKEVSSPVIFSILTTVIAFVPLLFMPGTTGKFWWPLPAVVIIVLIVSLLEAIYILPAHLGHTKKSGRTAIGRTLHGWQQAFARWFDRMVDKYYRKFLDATLRYRYVTISTAIAFFLIVGGYGISDHMGFVYMPEVSADEIEAGIRLPVGTTPEQAAKVAKGVTQSTRKMFDKYDLGKVSEGIKTNVRRGNFIDVEIVMKPPDERDMTAADIIALWRQELDEIEGISQVTFEAESGPGGHKKDISVDISHSDIAILEKASLDFAQRVKAYENTMDVT